MQREIGILIGQVRKIRGMSQVELARQLGTSQSAINRIEHGNQNLSLKTLSRIGHVLNYRFITFNKPGKPRVNISEDERTRRLIIEIDKLDSST